MLHLPQPVQGCQVLGWVCPCPPVSEGTAADSLHILCGQRRRGSSTSTLGQSQAVLPARGSAGSPWLCGSTSTRHLMATTVLLRRTPPWTMSWLLPTSLPKYTGCHHARTGQPSRPSSVVWSCHPLHPRKGSRSPLQRNSQRRHRFPQVRFPEVPRHVPGSSMVMVGLWFLVPAPALKRTQTKVGVPLQCHSAGVSPQGSLCPQIASS